MTHRFVSVLALATACALVLRSSAPAREVHAGTAIRLGLADLVDRAEDVVEGRVIDRRSYRAADGRIETEYRLRVDRALFGGASGTLAFRLPGGVLPDGSGTLIAGMPSFEPAEDVVVFLSAASARGTRVPIGLAQGKFRVVTDAAGRKSLLRQASGLSLASAAGAVDAPERASFDYDAVMADVERLVRTRDDRARARRDAERAEGR